MTQLLPVEGDLIAGKYCVEAEIGRGGMGAVYSARHVGTGRRFAIKLLNPQLAGDVEAEARFLREATLASAINHPAIVEVYDVGRHGGSPFMVMKLLEGESLGQRLKRGPLPPDQAIAALLPVLDGIAAAHAHGIVHRDLKPDNILLQRDGTTVQPKVLDFGISKLLGPETRTRLTKTGISLGTPLYMSPEQVRGDNDVDARSDVYTLGVILYEMLTGVLPFEGNNYPDLVLKIVMGGARGIRAHNPSLSAALEAIVARAMALSRDARYPSATHFAADLLALRGGVRARLEPRVSKSEPPTTSTPFTSEAQSRPPRAASRSNVALYLLGALAAVAVGAGLLWAMRPSQHSPAAAVAAPRAPTAAPRPAKERVGAPAIAKTTVAPAAPAPMVSPTAAIARPRARSEAEVAAPRSEVEVEVEAQSPAPARLPVAQPKPTAVNETAPRPEQNPPVLRARPARERDEARIKPPKSPEPVQPTQAPAPARRLPSEIIDPFEQ